MKDGVFGGINIPAWIRKHAEPEEFEVLTVNLATWSAYQLRCKGVVTLCVVFSSTTCTISAE